MPEGATLVPIGPFFPVLKSRRNSACLWKEKVVITAAFGNHRGVEKIADSQRTITRCRFWLNVSAAYEVGAQYGVLSQ